MRIVRQLVFYSGVLLGLMFSASPNKAQEPTTYHPGETIRVSVVFEGPDADKIVTANTYSELKSLVKPEQAGFQPGFGSNSNKTAPNTFELSFKVPDNQATGDYVLTQISANLQIGDSRVGVVYGPMDFPALKFRIENPNTIKKPAIKNVTVLPKS